MTRVVLFSVKKFTTNVFCVGLCDLSCKKVTGSCSLHLMPHIIVYHYRQRCRVCTSPSNSFVHRPQFARTAMFNFIVGKHLAFKFV